MLVHYRSDRAAAEALAAELEGSGPGRVDDYLTVTASGRAVGITSAATRQQHQRVGLVYRRVLDAPDVAVHMAWWRGNPPLDTATLIELIRSAYNPGRDVNEAHVGRARR